MASIFLSVMVWVFPIVPYLKHCAIKMSLRITFSYFILMKYLIKGDESRRL